MLCPCVPEPPEQVRPAKGEAPSPGPGERAEVCSMESSRLSCSLNVSQRNC